MEELCNWVFSFESVKIHNLIATGVAAVLFEHVES
jgi:hypothetical protein